MQENFRVFSIINHKLINLPLLHKILLIMWECVFSSGVFVAKFFCLTLIKGNSQNKMKSSQDALTISNLRHQKTCSIIIGQESE